MAKEIIEAEIKSNIGEVAKDTEKLADSAKDAQKGFKGLGGTIKGMGTALKAAGIGLIVGLLAKLMDVFRQNQTVVDTFNTAMEFLSLTFNDFFKFLQSNIDTASGFMDKIFGNEVVQSMIDFGRTLSIEVITRVKNLIQGIGGLGSALVKVFKGDFAGASETAKAAITDLTEVVTGNVVETVEMEKAITKVTDKIKDYAKSTLDSAKAITEMNKAAELAAVKNQQIIEQKDREAELQRQIRDDESKTFEDRIKANEKLGTILEEQKKLMLENADAIVVAAQAQYDKNKSDENSIALIQAKTEKDAVLAQITGFQSEQLVNQVALEKEKTQLALENADAQIQAYSDLAGALSSLAGENKQLAVASAIIDTFAGANKALREGAGTPLGFIQAAAIIAAGLANVRKILDTDVGSGGGGGSVPSDTGTPAPQVLSGAFTLGGGQEAQPVQAYVVTDDMTNNQNKLANIRRRATI
jgi:hypothetical protein